MRVFLAAYPWDLLDDDLDAVLDRLRGEVGVTGLALWAASPAVLHVRSRPLDPRLVRSEGGLLFHAEDRHYAATRCKPVAAAWLKGKDPLGRIVSACDERGMEVRAVISASRIGRMPQRHPETACKNVFGAESHVSICLANPDVASFLCGLVSELSTSPPTAGVVIRDFDIAWAEAFSPELRGLQVTDTASRSLLSLCFCESCRQGAGESGVDAAAACRSVEAMLQLSFDAGGPSQVGTAPTFSDDSPLGAFLRWRRDELGRLLGRLVQACHGDLFLHRGVDRGSYASLDEAMISVPAGVITRIENAAALPSAFASTARLNELSLPEQFAVGPRGPELVSTFSRAVELGFSGVEIDNFGLLPETAFALIKQAVRYARRSAEAG